MADSALKTDEEKKEYFDNPEVLNQKVEKLVKLIQASKHFVAFTGAGLSTSSGIRDYRSGINTVLQTGPGCWETLANIQKAQKEGKKVQGAVYRGMSFAVQINKARPSYSHMALVKLMQEGILKHIISQNIDGLHRKSGIPADKISEVHGNNNLEVCINCSKGYMRDYQVCAASGGKNHKTGRFCDDPKCKGPLKDSIINFGEQLDKNILNEGFEHGYKSDLMLSMGSSLRVTPACTMAEPEYEGNNLVIINLQKTPMDYRATLVIHAKIDTVMEKVMQKLKLTPPPFTLKRYMQVALVDNNTVKVRGIDEDGSPYTIFKSAKINNNQGFMYNLSEQMSEITIDLEFQGHYEEPNLQLKLNRKQLEAPMKIELVFNPQTKTWADPMSNGKKVQYSTVKGNIEVRKNQRQSKSLARPVIRRTVFAKK